MHINRFEVYRADLEPAKGSEMNKRRPCVVVSPNELNGLATVIVAPLTSRGFELQSRVPCTFRGRQGLILLDHLRAVDKMRLGEFLGSVDVETQQEICETLQEMFAY
ncbi:type II toxin-antitoxin system PemK/MazF family toxin [soil metagenome]